MMLSSFLCQKRQIRKYSILSPIIISNIKPCTMVIFRITVAQLKQHRPITMPVLIQGSATLTGHIEHNAGVIWIIKMNFNVAEHNLLTVSMPTIRRQPLCIRQAKQFNYRGRTIDFACHCEPVEKDSFVSHTTTPMPQ